MAGVGSVEDFEGDVLVSLGERFPLFLGGVRDEVALFVEDGVELDELEPSGSVSHFSIGDWKIVICHDLSLSGYRCGIT